MAVTKHVVFVSLPEWGHTRGMLCFIDSLLRIDKELGVTLYHHKSYDLQFDQLIKNIDAEASVQARLHSIGVGSPDVRDLFVSMGEMVDVTKKHFAPLVSGQSVESQIAFPPAKVFVVDFFAYHLLDYVKDQSSEYITFAWLNTDAASMDSKAKELFGDSELIEIEGRMPLYVWEKFAATGPFPYEMVLSVESPPFLSMDTRGHSWLLSFSRELAPPLTKWENAIKAKGGHALTVGPQYSQLQWQLDGLSFPSSPLYHFLDKQKDQSVVYVSLFWPVGNPQYVELLIDSLVAARKPFVISLVPETFPMIGPERARLLREKVTKSGIGFYFDEWQDQCLLLSHKAFSWVVSHGGTNTLMESLIRHLPLIVWPIGADQSNNAVLLAKQLDVAFELLQIRDRNAGKKLANYPGVVVEGTDEAVKREFEQLWKEVDGPVGERKRANAKKAGELLRKEHREKGESYAREFLELV